MNIERVINKLSTEYPIFRVDALKLYNSCQDKVYGRSIHNGESLNLMDDKVLNVKAYKLASRYLRLKYNSIKK